MDAVDKLTKFATDILRAQGHDAPEEEAGGMVGRMISRGDIRDLFDGDGKLDGGKALAALTAVMNPTAEPVSETPTAAPKSDEWYGMSKAEFVALAPEKRLQLAHQRDHATAANDKAAKKAREQADILATMPEEYRNASPTIRLAWINDKLAERTERELAAKRRSPA